MTASDDVAAALGRLPGGGDLAALRKKVSGAPAVIRTVMTRWQGTANGANELMGDLKAAVLDVDDAWQGASADAFCDYMRTYDKAGDGFHDALDGCAVSVGEVATKLTDASAKVDGICATLLNRVETHRRNNPDTEQSDLDKTFGPWVTAAVSDAREAIKPAEDAVGKAVATLETQVKDKLAHFALIRSPGSDSSIPTSGWQRTPGYRPRIESGGGLGGNGSEIGHGSGGYGGAPSGGGIPAPKKEVVEWIKEALTILRDHGVAVNPDDPATVDKIWTIIFHESGGNPQAINNWDSNAAAGIPSKGLMQTIDPTFQAHKQPGYNDIWNPVHNIMAGVRYTISRYGSLDGHPGITSLSDGGGYKPY
ncbi:transglycosylase SLT domain-containing protein [Streptosporangium sp. NPDC049644]|uniref:transglycosylase SLT domain-containing protein n=1 Tax=Streptosporangium sp. NPDC049644 TaxID=3155507 RepID=UPI00342592CF